MQVAVNPGQNQWKPGWHGMAIVVSALFLFLVVFWAAMGWQPLSGATVEWVVGFILASVVGLGIGTLATGVWVELKHSQWSPFGRRYLVFILAALAVLSGVQGLFFWWLFALQAGGTSRWIFWAFLAGATAFAAAGWYFTAPPTNSRPTGVVQTRGLWPKQDITRLQRMFIPLAILIGVALGASSAVGYIGGFAWADNSGVPSAPPMPAYSANIQGSYVALGDSYSAGEGLRPFVAGTDISTDDCHRAADMAGDPATGRNPAYATLLESWLPAADRGAFTFNACSGALIHEVLNPTKRDVLRIPAQYAGGRDPSVGLVTLTIGGNDAIFSQVVAACLLSDQCMTSTFPPFGITVAQGSTIKPGALYNTWAPQTIEEIGRNDATLFKTLRKDFPNARIIVIGYPYLFPEDPAPRNPFFSPLCAALLNRFNVPERKELRQLQDDLNDRTYEEAVAAGVEFVSPDAIWGDHVPCGQQQYTNSVKPFLNFASPIDGGSFHPNAAGQRTYAALLACYLDHYPEPGPNGAPDPYQQGHPHSITIPDTSLPSYKDLGLVDPPGRIPGKGRFSNC